MWLDGNWFDNHRGIVRGLVFLLIGLIIFFAIFHAFSKRKNGHSINVVSMSAKEELSDEVLEHKDTVEQYADEYGISAYVDCLLAIIQVETRGKVNDVMQSSESAGLAPDSLTTDESIRQGCEYFAELVTLAEEMGCDDATIIQAYNYGYGFINYVAENADGEYSFEIAEEFARIQSDGETVTYSDELAVEYNGGWRYKYGNMFYVQLVSKYL